MKFHLFFFFFPLHLANAAAAGVNNLCPRQKRILDDCHRNGGDNNLFAMSHIRQVSVYDKALQLVLRNKPLTSLNQLVCRRTNITALDLYERRVFQSPPCMANSLSFGFIPIMPTRMLRSIVETLAREERMKSALNAVATVEDRMIVEDKTERGYVFEEFHAQWYLAMKSHQTRKSFLKNILLSWDDASIRIAQEDLLSGKRQVASTAVKHLENTLPSCQLHEIYNNTNPLCSEETEGHPSLLLFGRYSIEEPKWPKGKPPFILGLNALDLIPNNQLHELLLGRILLRNIPYGAGYDYVEVNWHLSSPLPLLTFDFIEMKYSSPTSFSQLSYEDVIQKYKWVKLAYQRLVQQKLSSLYGTLVDFDFRLIVCSWRPCRADFAVHRLPQNILLYPLERLSQAYGPSVTSQGPFTLNNGHF